MAGLVSVICRRRFCPPDIGLLKVWLDAADVSTITLNGGKVSQWNDKSGNGNHETQGTDAARPTYVAGALNHKPALRFSGAQNMDKVFTGSLAQPNTIFAVYKYDAAGAGAQRLFDASAGLVQVNTALVINAGGSSVTLVNPYTRGSYEILAAVVNGAASSGYVNGVLKASGNPGTNTMTRLKIGSSGANTEYLQGDIAEIVVYNAAVPSCERVCVERYLAGKWGVALG